MVASGNRASDVLALRGIREMTTRSLSLLAAALLAGFATPALAQEHYDPGEPPPLPELTGHEWDDWDADSQEPYPGEPGEWSRSGPPSAGHGYRYGYLPGYPGPVMWVKVPIERERDCCACGEVVEETIVEHRPVATKRVKIQRIKRVK